VIEDATNAEGEGDRRGPNPPRIPTERPGPAGGKRDRNRRERTSALQRAALHLFLAQGISNTPIDAIARDAGVSKGSFYRYFEDKRELVAALISPLRDRLEHAFDACGRALGNADDSGSAFVAYYAIGAELESMVREHPDLARLYLQETRAPAVPAREPLIEVAALVARWSIELTELAQEHGILRAVTPAVSALTVIGAAERLLQAYLSGELGGDGASVAGELIGVILMGLQPES
jgi:AcrR family transcriptional regulator